MDTKKVWLVTGASKGLGLSLVKRLLNTGYKVAATSRTVESLEKEVGTFASFLPLKVNVKDETSVSKAIAKTLETFGTIDIVVNNEGYGSTTYLTVSEIAYELGFEHPQSFSKLFKSKTNLSSLEFRASFN